MKVVFFSHHSWLSSSSSSPNIAVLLSLSLYVLLIVFSSRSSEAVITLPKNVIVPAVLVFGDSFVDHGNNNNMITTARCNFPPYGKDIMGGIPTGRFTNGRTPADLIAEELGIKEFVPASLDPYLQPYDLLTGVSFANGGVGFDPLTPLLPVVLSMTDQLEMFKEYIGKLKEMVGEERTNFILSNSLYLVVAGTNDILNSYFASGIRRLQYDINSYTDFVVHYASDFIKELYKLGAKRIGTFSIPPIGCLPSQRTIAGGVLRECVENYNQAAQLFNTKLSSAISSLNSSLNDAKARLVYIDIYAPLLNLILNPQKYGFTVADRGCCGTGIIEVILLCNKLSELCPDDSLFVFWDSYHPTERGYRVLINQILQTYQNSLF